MNLYLRHQWASGPVSGGVFENVQHAKNNHPLMHTRLKQAASCIARLSREKQQLIEMANRLRAQITTAGLQGTLQTQPHTHTVLNHMQLYNKPADSSF